MKKKIIIIAIVILIMIGIGLGIWLFLKKPNQIAFVDEEDTTLNNISGQYSDVKITDFQTAKESIEGIKEEIKIKSVSDELEEKQNNSNETFNTYNFKQVYNGIEVIDGGLLVYADKDGNAKGIVNKYKEISELNTNPKNTQENLKEVVKNEIKKTYNIETEINDGKLVAYPYNDKYILAYEYEINIGLDNANIIVYVSDETKEIINLVSPFYSVDNYSEFYKDGKYIVEDTDRNIGIQKALNEVLDGNTQFEDYTWNSPEDAEKKENQLAIKTIQTVQKSYDYYKQKFNWISLNGQGNMKIVIITNAQKVLDDNTGKKVNFKKNAAFSSPNYFILGSSNKYNESIEVLGHEFTHGVFYYNVGECKLDTFQTNALDEAYADIMGMCIETYYNNSTELDWYIDCNPARDIKKSKVQVKDISKQQSKGDDGHNCSQIISRAAYLMNDAMTLEQFEKLWYQSMNLLPDNPNFHDCAYAVITTAREMKFSDEQIEKIASAFNSVGVNTLDILNLHTNQTDKWASEKFDQKENSIVGEWKATKTSNDTYSLGELYGTSVSMNNGLKLNANGTYTLYLGFIYAQEGKCQINGNIINLKDNKYIGDSPEHKIAQQLKINGDQIILEENADDNTSVNIIFENVKNISNNTTSTETNNNNNNTNTSTNTSTNNNTSTTTQVPSQATAKDFKVGSATVKYGTYKGTAAATGETLVLKSDGTATLNGKSYTFTVGKVDFAQDISSVGSYKDAIILKNSDGTTFFSVYVADDGTLCNEPNWYVYSGN